MRGRHFSITPSVEDGRHTLALAGELDMASARALESAISKACADGANDLVLELSELRFIDVRGVRALLAAKARCAEHGCRFSLRHESRQVRRTLDLIPALLADRPCFQRHDREMTRVLQERGRLANARRRGVPPASPA